MKHACKAVTLAVLAVGALLAFSGSACAQRLDFAFGVSNIVAPAQVPSSVPGINLPSMSGGVYPGFSGNVLFLHDFGVGSEIFWRASQTDYAGQGFNFRPVLWNVNAVYSPKLAPHAYLELVGGIGATSTRFYTGTFCGSFSCSNYQSRNHFDGDFGGGLKLYVKGGFFIRPEARFYIMNNNQEFSTNHATRAGVSIGYTFR